MARTIAQFVRSTRLTHSLVHATAALALHGIPVGAVVSAVAWLRPELWGTAVAVGLAWLGLVAVFLLLVRRGASLVQTDHRLGLRDRLVTWWSLRGTAAAPAAMAAWLERDLGARLAELPEERRRALWRRPARRLWWLIPILLLVWAIGPWGRWLMFTSPAGVTTAQEERTRQQPVPGPGSAPRGGKPDPQLPDPTPTRPEPSPGKQPELPPPQPTGTPDDPPPRPIPDLPAVDQFVIPRFIGEGEGRKERAKVAVVEEGGPPPTARRSTGSDTPDPEVARREFAAAAERARRSRFVPDNERGFVQRYFDELNGAVKKGAR